jgi:hypothetical protein
MKRTWGEYSPAGGVVVRSLRAQRLSLGTSEFFEEAHDAFPEEQEEQNVRYNHKHNDAFVQPGTDGLLPAEHTALFLTFHSGFAHGAPLGL